MAALVAGKSTDTDKIMVSVIVSGLSSTGILAKLTTADDASKWRYLAVLTFSYLSAAPQELLSADVSTALTAIQQRYGLVALSEFASAASGSGQAAGKKVDIA